MTRAKAQIVITSANSATAGLLIPALRQAGYRTTGLIRTSTPLETDDVITDWMQNPAARKALAAADYIIHLSGDANAKNNNAFKASNYTTTRLVADSAAKGNCRRLIYLSYANASTHEKNLYLRWKGQAEDLLRNTGKELVIFRCPVIVDAPGQTSRMDALFVSQKGRAVPTIGNGRQTMRPIYRGDVVAAILSALTNGEPGTYDLSGPEQFTIDEFIRLVNTPAAFARQVIPIQRAIDPLVSPTPTTTTLVPILHIPGWLAMLLSHFHPSLSPTFVDLMLHHTDSVFSPSVFRQLGLTPTPLSDLYRPAR